MSTTPCNENAGLTVGLRALLGDILDYAGLFPPAKLPLNEAITNYARYQREPEAWMLARFICPASRLTELDPFFADHFPEDRPLRLSVLGKPADDAEQFADHLKNSMESISAFHRQWGSRVSIEAFEVAVPAAGLDEAAYAAWLPRLGDAWSGCSVGALPMFLECPAADSWRESWKALLGGIAAWRADHAAGTQAMGFKLRCGGLDASAFPSVAQVAFAIHQAARFEVPMKFTAGLHHPIRHHNDGVNTMMHGFLNVFSAGILARACQLGEPAIAAILEAEDAGSFVLTEHDLAYEDHRVSWDDVGRMRREAVTSFGSCSFDEPRDDLRELRLL
ncbi:MAG: hypothetical protein ACYTHJ_01725 [Planctomycetota bacterium]